MSNFNLPNQILQISFTQTSYIICSFNYTFQFAFG